MVMMPRFHHGKPDDYYRQQAKYAQDMSDRAIAAFDKACWLDIAKSWLALIRVPKRTKQ